jgi:hypothetical protein
MWKVYRGALDQNEIGTILDEMIPGLSPASVRVKDDTGERRDIPGIRNNLHSYSITNHTNQMVLERVGQCLEAGDFKYGRISKRVRMYGYASGMRFKPHIDGREPTPDGYENVYTVLLYLQLALNGGETVLYNLQTEEARKIDRSRRVVPEVDVGDVLVFDRRYWHEGAEVFLGSKYVLRTDLQSQVGP